MSLPAPAERALLARPRNTDNLLLRPIAATDLAPLLALETDPRIASFRRPRASNVAEAQALLTGHIAHWDTHGYGRWAIEHQQRVVGFGGVSHRAGWDGLNLGYFLAPEAWGRGFATEVATEVLAWARQYLPHVPVFAVVRPGNAASIRVLEKVGLQQQPGTVELQDEPALVFRPAG